MTFQDMPYSNVHKPALTWKFDHCVHPVHCIRTLLYSSQSNAVVIVNGCGDAGSYAGEKNRLV